MQQDQNREGIMPGLPAGAGAPPEEQGDGRRDERFSLHRFPELPAGAEPRGPKPRRSMTGRLILSAILFLAIVGGLAFLLQYVPSWRKKNATSVAAGVPKAILFHGPPPGAPMIRAMWDWIDNKGEPVDTGYFMEYEHGEAGHFDFSFENVTSETAELGLLKTSCDCSNIEMAVLSSAQWDQWQQIQKARQPGERPDDAALKDFPWQPLKAPEKGGGTPLPVPGMAKGLLRVSWTSRKSEGQALNLAVDVWSQPQGKPAQRDYTKLVTGSVIVASVMFSRAGIAVGTLGPGSSVEGQLFCWSATRHKMKLEIAKDDPRFTWDLKPMNRDECKDLEQALRTSAKAKTKPPGIDIEMDTRVRAAYRLRFKIYEERGGKQLDLGPFYEPIPVRLDGNPLTRGVPMISGVVRGEVDVGANDQGKVNLGSFPANADGKKTIFLWTNPKTTLKLVQYSPQTMRVQLSEDTKDSTAQRRCWRLVVEVPRGTQAGPLPDDSAIILHTQSTPPRQIRIPIIGTAVQG